MHKRNFSSFDKGTASSTALALSFLRLHVSHCALFNIQLSENFFSDANFNQELTRSFLAYPQR